MIVLSTASITEIFITSADIAKYMRETSDFSEQIKNRAIESKEIINTTSSVLDNYVASIEESVNKVNALALNATIEAA